MKHSKAKAKKASAHNVQSRHHTQTHEPEAGGEEALPDELLPDLPHVLDNLRAVRELDVNLHGASTKHTQGYCTAVTSSIEKQE